MIYQDSLRFLKQHIKNISTNYKWSELDNIDYFNTMYKRYTHDEIEASISEVGQAFKDLFQGVGKLIFKYDTIKGIIFKVLPYSVSPKRSQHLNNIITIILQNRENIEHKHNQKDEQIILKGKIRRHINSEIVDSKEAVNKKELIKEAIRQALQLNTKDIILLFKRKYIVRIFNEPKKVVAVKEEAVATLYSEESLAVDHNDFFEEVDYKTFLDASIDVVMDNALSFQKSDNSYYEQHAHKAIKDALYQELSKYLEDSSDYIEAFSEYIFKKDFIPIHERIASSLLYEVVRKNEEAKKFLEYYSGEIILSHGKKYQLPYLQTQENGKWNIVSVISIATMWIKTNEKKDLASIELNKTLKVLNDVQGSLINLESQFDASQQLQMENHDLQTRLIQKQDQISSLEKERNKLKVEVHKLEQNLSVNNSSYKVILTALTKALMQRKSVI